MSREAFEKWARTEELDVFHDGAEYVDHSTNCARVGWQARQPEIDALKAEVERLKAAPTPEVEPAVYYFGFINRTFTYTRFKDEAAAHQKRIAEEGGIEQRLYTRPATDELVKAAEALRDFVKMDVRWNDERDRLLANLNTALDKVKS